MRRQPRALPPDHPVEHMRALADALAPAIEDPQTDPRLAAAVAWLVSSVRRFSGEAADGVDLVTAFGLRGAAGKRRWTTVERCERRNHFLREAAAALGDVSPNTAAQQLSRMIAQNSRRKRAPADAAGRLLAEAAKMKALPVTVRTIREILVANTPLFAPAGGGDGDHRTESAR